MRLGDADDGTSGGVFGADERGQGLSVPGDGRADGHDGAGAASSICAGAQDGAADLLSFLVSRGAQEQLVHQGLFSVREDLALYPSGWAAEVEQAARRAIVMPDAFQSDEALRQKAWQDFR